MAEKYMLYSVHGLHPAKALPLASLSKPRDCIPASLNKAHPSQL